MLIKWTIRLVKLGLKISRNLFSASFPSNHQEYTSTITSRKICKPHQIRKYDEKMQISQEIYSKHVMPTFKRHSGYSVFVTGHGWGGAMAPLFPFLVAGRKSNFLLETPVVCASIGSPLVGDYNFLQAHRFLDLSG